MNHKVVIKLKIRRFIAAIIDWYLSTMLAATSVTFFTTSRNEISADIFNILNYDKHTALFIAIYSVCVGVMYYVLYPFFVSRGQTLGKKIMKIKVLSSNLNQITLWTIIKRELIGSTILEGGLVVTAIYIRQLLVYFTPINYQLVMNVAYFTTLLSLVIAYFDKSGRTIHDLVSDTVVVNCSD